MNEPYPVTSLAYLRRASDRLNGGSATDLFYAAFELRAGIEARLQEYLEPHDHVPRNRKQDYRIAKLGQAAKDISLPQDQVMRFAIRRESTMHLKTLLYTPVTKDLRGNGERLGNLLHAQRSFHEPADPWWRQQQELLDTTYRQLLEANVGTMMGVASLNPTTGLGEFAAVIPDDEIEEMLALKAELILASVEHLPRVPEADVLAFVRKEGLRI